MNGTTRKRVLKSVLWRKIRRLVAAEIADSWRKGVVRPNDYEAVELELRRAKESLLTQLVSEQYEKDFKRIEFRTGGV